MSKIYSNGKYDELIAMNDTFNGHNIHDYNIKCNIHEFYMKVFTFLKEYPDKHELIGNILVCLGYYNMDSNIYKFLSNNLNIIIIITNNYTYTLFKRMMINTSSFVYRYMENIISDLIMHINIDIYYYANYIVKFIKTYDEMNLFLEMFDIKSNKLKDEQRYDMFIEIMKKDYLDLDLLKIFNPGYQIYIGYDWQHNKILTYLLDNKNLTIDMLKYICNMYVDAFKNKPLSIIDYRRLLNTSINHLIKSNYVYKHRNILNYLIEEIQNCQFIYNYNICMDELCETFDNI